MLLENAKKNNVTEDSLDFNEKIIQIDKKLSDKFQMIRLQHEKCPGQISLLSAKLRVIFVISFLTLLNLLRQLHIIFLTNINRLIKKIK